MAYSLAFAPSQIVGQDSVLILTDESTGEDVAIASRRVYLIQSDDSYLTPSGATEDYIDWPLGQGSLAIDALDRSYALRITVQCLNALGGVLYTTSGLYLLTLSLEQFYYDLTQTQSGTPRIVEDTRYYESKIKLRCALDEAENALTIGADHYSAQAALDRGQFLVDHQTLYF